MTNKGSEKKLPISKDFIELNVSNFQENATKIDFMAKTTRKTEENKVRQFSAKRRKSIKDEA